MPMYINNIDTLPEGLTWEDLQSKSDTTKLKELATKVELPDFSDIKTLKEYADYFNIDLPQAHNVADGSFATTFEALDTLNQPETKKKRKKPARQKFIQEIIYNYVFEARTGHEPILQLGLSDFNTWIAAFQQAGLVNDKGQIVFPVGTILTYKCQAPKPVKTRFYVQNGIDYSEKSTMYDIYYVTGHPKCLVAIDPSFAYDLFGVEYQPGF